MATDQTNTGPWLHEVIGENLRRWRESKGHRQDDVAALARNVGLTWTQATVAQIETGRRETLERLSELVLVSEFTGLSLGELVDSDSPIWLAPGVGAPVPSADADAEWLMAKLGGERVDRGLRTPADHIAGGLGPLKSQWPGAQKWKLAQVSMDSQRTAEQRVAAALNRDPLSVSLAAWQLWDQGLTDERDARARKQYPNGANPQALGRVTRTLVDELFGEPHEEVTS